MVKGLIYILLLATIGLSGYQIWERWPVPPCQEPITYTIGSFDARFNLSEAQFLAAIREAEAVWEGPSGRDLFAHSSVSAELPINLIYDYRQQVTETLGAIESDLKSSEANYRLLESRYEAMKREYESLKADYESRLANYESMSARYEARIESWNAGPRSNKQEYESLEAERQAVNAEVDRIRAMEASINAKVRELNQLVERLNRMARELNLDVEQYNTIGASRGETFEGGVYISDGRGAEISIYEFSSRDKLVRVLAHELGHALGLEHVSDPQAIMYHLNQSDAGAATQADLVALESLCADE